MRHTGLAPFGFEWKGDELCVVEKQAQVRRLAFELYAELRNKAAVARRLNELGHCTQRDEKWSDVSVDRILSCSSAIGRYSVGTTALSSEGVRLKKPPEECDFIKCPSIVSEELWEMVQAALGSRSKPGSATTAKKHAFTGIIFCSCGSRMNASSSSPKYVCARCSNRIPAQDLENRFLEEVLRYYAGKASTNLSQNPELFRQSQLLLSAQEKVRQIGDKLNKIDEDFLANQITAKSFEELHRPLEEQRREREREVKTIRARITKLEASAASQPSPPPPVDLDVLRQRWPNSAEKFRREIIYLFVDRITVAEDGLHFTYKLHDSSEEPAKRRRSPHPTNSPASDALAGDEPHYIPLPKPGHRCKWTGLSRSKLNELILENERNSFSPPVESISLAPRKGGRGTRLIVWQSLKEYLAGRL